MTSFQFFHERSSCTALVLYSGPTGITLVNDTISASPPDRVGYELSLQRCVEIGGHSGLLFLQDGEVADALDAAYRLYTQVKDDKKALSVIRDHPVMANRERRPSLKKPALLASFVAFKPVTKEHRDRCSDYANVLQCADENSVPSEEFPCWLADTTVTACKKAMRATRALCRKASANMARPEASRHVINNASLCAVTTNDTEGPVFEVRVRSTSATTDWLEIPLLESAVEELVRLRGNNSLPAADKVGALALALSSVAGALAAIAVEMTMPASEREV